MTKTLRISIAVNIVFLSAAIFFTWKRFRFNEGTRLQRHQHTYLDNPQYKEQVNIQSAYDKQANIVMLGNSHVYKAQWDALLHRSDVTARGIGSDITDGYLARLDQVINVHPKVVFIEGGANDVYYERPADSILLNLKLIANQLQAQNIRVVLHTIPPERDTIAGSGYYNDKVLKVNQRILQLCKDENIPCIDLFTLLSQGGSLSPAYANIDGVHFNAEGYKIWAREIEKMLPSTLPSAPPPA